MSGSTAALLSQNRLGLRKQRSKMLFQQKSKTHGANSGAAFGSWFLLVRRAFLLLKNPPAELCLPQYAEFKNLGGGVGGRGLRTERKTNLSVWPIILLKNIIIHLCGAVSHQHYSLAAQAAPSGPIKLQKDRKKA